MLTTTSPSSWRATYDDGRVVYEAPGRYAELERDRVRSFGVYLNGSFAPLFAFDVPRGRRLVYRTRVWPRTGRRMLMLGTESEDRSEVDVHLIDLDGDTAWHGHLTAYGTDATTGAPVLYEFEGVRG